MWIPGAPEGPHAAQFTRFVDWRETPVAMRVLISADTVYRLRVNGVALATGPAAPASDWTPPPAPPTWWIDRIDVPSGLLSAQTAFDVDARFGMVDGCMSDVSTGRPGLTFTAEAEFADGRTETVASGADGLAGWKARLLPSYLPNGNFDASKGAGAWTVPSAVEGRRAELSPIPVRSEIRIEPTDGCDFTIPAHGTCERTARFDRIRGAFFSVQADGFCRIEIGFFERDPGDRERRRTVTFAPPCGTAPPGDGAVLPPLSPSSFSSLELYSVGGFTAKARALDGERDVRVRIRFTEARYPVDETTRGRFECSDPALNRVVDVCTHTLSICRQTLHLDSTSHQEPLACTGDYYVETWMTAAAFGDMRLSAMDVRRTAETLRLKNGRLFHTSYSLVWARMLRDVWFLTGERALLEECVDALEILLARFAGYIGETGLVENPPDWMFLDWLVVDGHSLHHPPKYLGQSAMNAFYIGALSAAAEVFGELGMAGEARAARDRAAAVRAAFVRHLWDPGRGLFTDGLGTPQKGDGPWLPENENRRHHSLHANALAALHVLDGGRAAETLRRALDDASLDKPQPYFMHFVFEAMAACGLFREYGMRWLREWIPMTEKCGIGLAEGWTAPEKGYSFDHSHAWGGTPAFQLPWRMLGLELLEPGWKRVRIAPDLLGLESASIAVPTPHGMLRAELRRGREPEISVPPGVAAER